LQQRSWESAPGERRSKVEVVADEIAPSLKFATAQVTRNDFRGGDGERSGGGGGGGGRAVPNEPMYDPDEEPF
jgi:single-strand DNA-binding protein